MRMRSTLPVQAAPHVLQEEEAEDALPEEVALAGAAAEACKKGPSKPAVLEAIAASCQPTKRSQQIWDWNSTTESVEAVGTNTA